MTAKSKKDVKAFFETSDKPTEAQFIDLIDSYVDKSGPIGTLETAASAGGTGAAVFAAGTPSIASYAALRTSQGIEVYTSAQSDDIARSAFFNILPTATSGAIEKTGATTFGVFTVSDFAKTLLDDENSAAARATLGVSGQVIFTAITAGSSTADIPDDNTVPTNSEGTEIYSQAITLSSASNRVLIQSGFTLLMDAGNRAVASLFRGSTNIGTVVIRPGSDEAPL